MPIPNLAEQFHSMRPLVDLPASCTSAILVCEFADGSVHAGVAIGDEDDADRLIRAAGDMYGLTESGTASLENVHWDGAGRLNE